MKKILFVTLLFLSTQVNAGVYHVSTGGALTNNGSVAAPWNFTGMLSRINDGTLKAFDSILFKKGDVFNSFMNVTSSNAANFLYFGSYGTGAKPRFWYYDKAGVFRVIGKVGWTFDGLNFEDVNHVNDHVAVSPMNCGIRLGLFSPGGTTSNNCTIKNCDVKNAGLGFVINGSNNRVLNCTVSNLGNVVNTPNTGGATAYEDYGANSITLKGNDNYFENCTFTDAWCASYDFGFSGGAIEFYGACSRNKFYRCTIYDCGAVGEFGADVAGTLSAYNEITYSAIINCGSESYVNFNNVFATTVKNLRYWNNVIVETSASRFSTATTGLPAPYDAAWKAGTSPTGERTRLAFSQPLTVYPDTIFDLRNNIYYLRTSQKIANSATVASKTVRLNNLYDFSAGSTTNYSNGAGDINGAAGWVSTAGNPATWNYDLTAGSLAINAGMPLGFTADKQGRPIVNAPDIGVAEYTTGVVVTPPVNGTRTYILTNRQRTPLILKPQTP
jgi:parallel beta-helix repeat protein